MILTRENTKSIFSGRKRRKIMEKWLKIILKDKKNRLKTG